MRQPLVYTLCDVIKTCESINHILSNLFTASNQNQLYKAIVIEYCLTCPLCYIVLYDFCDSFIYWFMSSTLNDRNGNVAWTVIVPLTYILLLLWY